MVRCSHTLDSHTHDLINTVSEQGPSHQTERSVQIRASPVSATCNQRAIKEKEQHTRTPTDNTGVQMIFKKGTFTENYLSTVLQPNVEDWQFDTLPPQVFVRLEVKV